MEEIDCSEMLAHKIQMTGNHPKERIQHSEHGESLKFRTFNYLTLYTISKNQYIAFFYYKHSFEFNSFSLTQVADKAIWLLYLDSAMYNL